jgi:hypothetical protein
VWIHYCENVADIGVLGFGHICASYSVIGEETTDKVSFNVTAKSAMTTPKIRHTVLQEDCAAQLFVFVLLYGCRVSVNESGVS